MARRPRRQYRRRGGRRGHRRYLRGKINADLTVDFLAPNTGVRTLLPDSVDAKTWISSIVADYTLQDYTHDADKGPLSVYVAHGDYSTAEIEAFIERDESWNASDLVNQELARRKIKLIGTFQTLASGSNEDIIKMFGHPKKTKLGWMLHEGQSVAYFVYNSGTAALSATLPSVHAEGHANLWPR